MGTDLYETMTELMALDSLDILSGSLGLSGIHFFLDCFMLFLLFPPCSSNMDQSPSSAEEDAPYNLKTRWEMDES